MMETWQWWLVALGIIGILSAVAYGLYYHYWPRSSPLPESTLEPEFSNQTTVPLYEKPIEHPPCSLFIATELSAPPAHLQDQNRWKENKSISPSALERQQHLTRENHRFLSLSPFLGQQHPSPSPVSTAHHSVQTRTPSPGRWSSWKRHS